MPFSFRSIYFCASKNFGILKFSIIFLIRFSQCKLLLLTRQKCSIPFLLHVLGKLAGLVHRVEEKLVMECLPRDPLNKFCLQIMISLTLYALRVLSQKAMALQGECLCVLRKRILNGILCYATKMFWCS